MLSPLISASLRPFLCFLVRTKTFSTHNKPKNNHDVRRKRFNAHAWPEIPSASQTQAWYLEKISKRCIPPLVKNLEKVYICSCQNFRKGVYAKKDLR